MGKLEIGLPYYAFHEYGVPIINRVCTRFIPGHFRPQFALTMFVSKEVWGNLVAIHNYRSRFGSEARATARIRIQ